MLYSSLLAAVICLFAPFTIPIGVIPISLATFAVYIASSALGRKYGIWAITIYILLGAAGLPVFSGFTGGIAKIAGLRAVISSVIIPCCIITGYLRRHEREEILALPPGDALGTVMLYACGSVCSCTHQKQFNGHPCRLRTSVSDRRPD
jgi:biotin transport system substrate-specific component